MGTSRSICLKLGRGSMYYNAEQDPHGGPPIVLPFFFRLSFAVFSPPVSPYLPFAAVVGATGAIRPVFFGYLVGR